MALKSSKSRQNYSERCEALINKQINVEQFAYHQYLALTSFYDGQEIALKGFAKFFEGSAERSKRKVDMFIDYQNSRGGKVLFCQISAPSAYEWQKPIAAIELVLEIEKNIIEELLKLRKAAQDQDDFHLTHFLDSKIIKEAYELVDNVARMLTNLNRVGDGLGAYIFDKELH